MSDATLETVTAKVCAHCAQPIQRGHNYRTKKFCSRPCYNATKPYSPERAKAAFWSRVNMEAPNGCWEYRGARDKWGYGDISYLKKHIQAHRLSWKLLRGDPGEKDVLHKCHNPPCCNPDHLYLGTDLENARDRVRAGTQSLGRPKLTAEQVVEIRGLYRRTSRRSSNAEELASKYSVSAQTIMWAAEGKTWRHLPRV